MSKGGSEVKETSQQRAMTVVIFDEAAKDVRVATEFRLRSAADARRQLRCGGFGLGYRRRLGLGF